MAKGPALPTISGETMRKQSRKAATVLCVILSAFLFSIPTQAIIVGGGSLEYLVGKASIVIKARVVSIVQPEFEHLAFVIEPLVILQGSGQTLPMQILVKPAEPIWPRQLEHPYQRGTVALFFLEKQGDRFVIQNNINAILPAMDAPTQLSAGASLKQNLLQELKPVLGATKSDIVRARLLVLLAQLAPRAQESIFIPFLDSSSIWEQRAAMAALLRLNPTPERVETASRDFKAFLAEQQDLADEYQFWDLFEEVLYIRFRYKVEKDDTVALLPLYRTIADVSVFYQDRGNRRGNEIALYGLARANQREDALRLYHYVSSQNAYLRHQSLGALCRMFDLPLKPALVTSYEMPLSPSVIEREQQMQKAVREALERRGVLPR
jgi:hypothetical protein